jgi:hypothetical protein
MRLCLALAVAASLWLAACASAPPAPERAIPVMDTGVSVPAEAVAEAPEGPGENEWGGEIPQPLPAGEVGAEALGEIS